MRALLSHEAGGPETLSLEDVDIPEPQAGQVRVSVEACSVNYPDALIIEDRYQYKPSRPFSPGAEIAGVISAVGPDVTAFAVGDRVLSMCGWGGMAEAIVLDAQRCFKMPEGMPFEDASAFLMTFGTAFYALKQRAAMAPGKHVLVLGAGGGVGLAATQLAAAMGANVVAATSTEAKLAIALENSAATGITYSRDLRDSESKRALAQSLKAANQGEGFDIIIDTVGGELAEPAIRALGWDGRYLTIGFPAGIPLVPLNLLLLKGGSAIGVFYGAFVDHEPEVNRSNNDALMALYRQGKIKPVISARYDLASAPGAIASLASGTSHGKLVVFPKL